VELPFFGWADQVALGTRVVVVWERRRVPHETPIQGDRDEWSAPYDVDWALFTAAPRAATPAAPPSTNRLTTSPVSRAPSGSRSGSTGDPPGGMIRGERLCKISIRERRFRRAIL
jgi:hypothetical protein